MKNEIIQNNNQLKINTKFHNRKLLYKNRRKNRPKIAENP